MEEWQRGPKDQSVQNYEQHNQEDTSSWNNEKNDKNHSATFSDENNQVQEEINRMLILSSWDIFNNEKFNIRDFDHVDQLSWVHKSTILTAPRITHRMLKKDEDGKIRWTTLP